MTRRRISSVELKRNSLTVSGLCFFLYSLHALVGLLKHHGECDGVDMLHAWEAGKMCRKF
jgi:hypothetical protein